MLADCSISEGRHVEVSILVNSGAVWESSQAGIEFWSTEMSFSVLYV